ncbi:MAG TPA: hypothetical protein PLG90_03080 [Ignavibacteria bacterium]|nr:hypothetical protein [Ignavibacteria bacterium]
MKKTLITLILTIGITVTTFAQTKETYHKEAVEVLTEVLNAFNNPDESLCDEVLVQNLTEDYLNESKTALNDNFKGKGEYISLREKISQLEFPIVVVRQNKLYGQVKYDGVMTKGITYKLDVRYLPPNHGLSVNFEVFVPDDGRKPKVRDFGNI